MLQTEIRSIPNHVANRTYQVRFEYAVFRCQQEVDPKLTNIAHLTVTYAPNQRLYDFVSLMTYLRSFEPESLSLETCANQIVDDFVAQLDPIWVRVEIEQKREHGIVIQILAEHGVVVA